MKMKRRITMQEAKLIGKTLGITSRDFTISQFKMGMQVELEHGTITPLTNISDDNLLITGKIALAHLNEIPDYYTRLLKLEKDAKKTSK